MLQYNRKLKKFGQRLRREMTDAERKIWSKIRRKQINGLQFFRQKSIGNYIVDFYCPKARLIIEIDGGQHYEYKALISDKSRDLKFEELGFKVIRFTNIEILKNIEGVVLKISEILPNPPL